MTAATLPDQLMEAFQQVDALCGANGHLADPDGDIVLSEVVEFAANGRHTNAFDLLVGGGMEPRVRVVTADPHGLARYPHEPPPKTTRCDRCGLEFGPSTVGSKARHSLTGELVTLDSSSAWGDRDGSRHVVWIPAGSVVVEVTCCRVCRDYLDSHFGPVVWS